MEVDGRASSSPPEAESGESGDPDAQPAAETAIQLGVDGSTGSVDGDGDTDARLSIEELPPPTSPPMLTASRPTGQGADQYETATAEQPGGVAVDPVTTPRAGAPPRSEVLTLGYGMNAPAESTRYHSTPGVSPHPDLFDAPDTAMDALELPPLSMRAASVRGRDHRYDGTARQDSYAFGVVDGVLTCAVADGVGSASHSHIAATVASRWAATSRQLHARHLALCANAHGDRSDAHPPVGTDAGKVDLTQVASQILAEVEQIEGIGPTDMASTLVAATIQIQPALTVDGADSDPHEDRWLATLYSIGDSGFAVIRCDEWHQIPMESTTMEGQTGDSHDVGADGEASKMSLAQSTGIEALPSTTTALSRTVVLRPGDVLVLATDGILDLVAGVEAFRDEIAGLWSEQDPTMAQVLRVVDGLVKSYSDDRTIIAIRVGGRGDAGHRQQLADSSRAVIASSG